MPVTVDISEFSDDEIRAAYIERDLGMAEYERETMAGILWELTQIRRKFFTRDDEEAIELARKLADEYGEI